MRLAARQAQAGQATEETRRGIEDFRQQRVADMAAQARIAAALAHVCGRPSTVAARRCSCGCSGACARCRLSSGTGRAIAAVLGHRQQHRRHIEPAERRALFVASLRGKTRARRCSSAPPAWARLEQAPPCRRQGFVVARWRRGSPCCFSSGCCMRMRSVATIKTPSLASHATATRLRTACSATAHARQRGASIRCAEQALRVFRLLLARHQRPAAPRPASPRHAARRARRR